VIAKPEVRSQLRICLAAARKVEAELAAGERLGAARSVVELIRAYDRIQENIRLVPLSVQEQEFLRRRLAPVAELLRGYQLR
jgi:hypothetical protein